MKYFANIKKVSGFSLAEILVITVIIGVGLVAVAQFQGGIYKSSSLSKQRVEALNLAEQKLEDLRHFATSAEYEANFINPVTRDINGSSNINGTSSPTTFTRAYNIDVSSDGLSADISIKVTWPDLSNGGSVTDNTTVYLATTVSNTTPLLLSTSGATDLPGTTETIEIILPDLSGPDPEDNACNCNKTYELAGLPFGNTYASILSKINGFIKVGGGMGGHSFPSPTPEPAPSPEPAPAPSTTTTTSTTYTGLTGDDCVECCDDAYPSGLTLTKKQKAEEALMYAKLDKLFNRYIKPVSKYEDRVIGNETFDARFLLKGYGDFVLNPKDILNTGGMGGGGMGGMGGPSPSPSPTPAPAPAPAPAPEPSPPPTVDYYFAACSYEVVTTITTTVSGGITTISETQGAPQNFRKCARWMKNM